MTYTVEIYFETLKDMDVIKMGNIKAPDANSAILLAIGQFIEYERSHKNRYIRYDYAKITDYERS